MTLAVITLGVTTGRGVAKCVLCFWVEPALRLTSAAVGRLAFRQLFGYGIWHFLLSVSRTVAGFLGPALIGARLGPALVTPYSIAARLVGYASSTIIAATGVLTPLAASFDADENQDRQRTLFLEGGKYATALALFFLALFLFLGKPLLRLWMGPTLDGAFPLLVILVVGETLPMSQWCTQSIILGMGRHASLALLNILEIVVAVPLALFLMTDHGLAGVAIAFVGPGSVFRGVLPMLLGCRLVQVTPTEYWLRTLFPAFLVGGLTALELGVLVRWQAPGTWLQLIEYTATAGVSFLLLAGVGLVGVSRLPFFSKRRPTPARPLPPRITGGKSRPERATNVPHSR